LQQLSLSDYILKDGRDQTVTIAMFLQALYTVAAFTGDWHDGMV
jgi:hypothetical protein